MALVREIDQIHRSFTATYRNGIEIEKFDPWLCWSIGTKCVEIESRNSYGFGFMWGYRIGCFSRIKHRFIEIGRLTLFLNLGECPAHNPRTGEVFKDILDAEIVG